ncbi:MAG: ATP phosphoribosyltransferase regulatory subunit [Actinomycetota bacterium]|nr:ATP phosphoribosyltransferase regulatory subunit [Actinomycetota bacterium]
MRPMTPRGFRDALPQEAAERERISSVMSEVLESWGYGRVETPVVEDYAVLERGAGASLEGTAFRLFDADGRLLALRPEMTVPIARLVASRLAGESGTKRLRYVADVFREQASLRGQLRQFTQVGVELIGEAGPAADAEVIAVFVEALEATGLREFTVGVGTVAVLRCVIEAAGMELAWNDAVLRAAHERNLVAIDELAVQPGVPASVASALSGVPRVRGGREAIDACRELVAGCGGSDLLDELAETWDLLATLGVDSRVSLDFGIMRSFDYYTGVVLEVYAPGIGLAIGGGGRYDGVLAEFDAPAPAAGFAVGLERLHIALAEQGAEPAVRRLDALLGGSASEAFPAAARLRSAGWRVRLAIGTCGPELAREAAAACAVEALLVADGRILRLDRAGERVAPLAEPLPAPPSLADAIGGEGL